MNYKKLVLVGFISAFVAVLTSVLGVTGTIIGSVISSVLYNMLSEALENPVSQASFSHDFEWEIAYVFPLIVIALIQLLLIFALLSEFGLLPSFFVNAYLLIQNFANNNLYRILGLALLVISAYPLVLKPDFVKKEHGLILIFVGVIFLARGFVDFGNGITNLYGIVFMKFDLPIAIIAFILLSHVIVKILKSANKSEKDFKAQKVKNFDPEEVLKEVKKPKKHHDFHNDEGHKIIRVKKPERQTNHYESKNESTVKFKQDVEGDGDFNINTSSGEIQFESNDLLDDYKK